MGIQSSQLLETRTEFIPSMPRNGNSSRVFPCSRLDHTSTVNITKVYRHLAAVLMGPSKRTRPNAKWPPLIEAEDRGERQLMRQRGAGLVAHAILTGLYTDLLLALAKSRIPVLISCCQAKRMWQSSPSKLSNREGLGRLHSLSSLHSDL